MLTLAADMEMRLILGRLIWNFDIVSTDGAWQWDPTDEMKNMRCEPRSAVHSRIWEFALTSAFSFPQGILDMGEARPERRSEAREAMNKGITSST